MTNTRSLIQRILAGNKKAFQTLIEENQRLVSYMVFRMVVNKADREDLCQDVFLKVYQNLSKFNFESKFSTWIAKITYNTCLDFLEKEKTRCLKAHTLKLQSHSELSEDYLPPDQYTEKKDISLRLKSEIDKMSVHFRTILTLYHLQEMSYVEISEVMQIPEGTVKSYLFRARKLLKQKLMVKYQKEGLWH
ncbi:MAG: hypothetical protein AMJ90_08080 [candidate division Zixibacteria bacterium SM23_73_2]|nr:MAG: hypothetical protein AMJ90_08080 [candidate division Zixibacteria bacterium SM23_73_2]